MKQAAENPSSYLASSLFPLMRFVVKLGIISCSFVYVIIPVVVHLNPWILTELVFLHKVRWPPFINLSEPLSLGLNNTRPFRIESTDNVNLGAWHVLPKIDKRDPIDQEEITYIKEIQDPNAMIVLYLHGNAGTRAGRHRIELYKVLSANGYHVVLFDYRGFGDSTGTPSEDGVVMDAYAAYKWIKQHNQEAVVIVWGHSLGSAIATKLVMQLNDDLPDCLVLETPFNNLQAAAFSHPLATVMTILPWFDWAFLDSLEGQHLHFETDKNLLSVKAPVLILHAEDDGIVPYELGKALYDGVKQVNPDQEVNFVTFDGKHNYGHKHLWKAPELPEILRKFVHGTTMKSDKVVG